MNETLENLKKLSLLANLVLDAELAKLAHATRHRDLVREQISNLDEELKMFKLQRAEINPGDPLMLHTKDKGWQDWRRATRANLNAGLANAEAARESARMSTKIAFGRAQVVEELVSMNWD